MGAPIPDIIRIEAIKHVPGQGVTEAVFIEDHAEAGKFFDTAHELALSCSSLDPADLSAKPHYAVSLIGDEPPGLFVTMKVCEDCFLIGEESLWQSDPEGKLWNKLDGG